MNRAELREMAENNEHVFMDRGTFPVADVPDEDMLFLKDKFPFAFDFLKEFGGTGIAKKFDADMYQYFMVCDRFSKEHVISDSALRVARLDCGAQCKNVIYSNAQHCFQFEDGQIIAENIEDLFGYMMSDESILPINILPETLEKLRSFGWHEGRRIDVCEIEEKFRSDGTPLTEMQVQFLQEFGGIKGICADGVEFVIYDRIRMPKWRYDSIVYFTPTAPSSEDLHSYGPRNIIAYNNHFDMLRIGEVGIMWLWLSTDGKMFRDDGAQLGRTAMEGMQTALIGW